MDKKIVSFLMVFVCMLFLSNAWAEEGEKDINIELKTGVHGAGVDAKTKVKVGEYDVLDVGAHPDFSFFVDGKIEGAYFSGGGTYYEDEDQEYHANVDMQRYVTEEFSYHRFWHWLDHDPLTNLAAATTNDGTNRIVPLVTYTNYEPGREYGIMRSEMESKTTVRVPMELPFELKTFFNYRKEVRRGERQAVTMSKCSSCHVVSHSKNVNEYIEDYNPGFIATYRNGVGRFNVSYEYLDRKFGESALPVENYYDEAVHPGAGDHRFDDRILYQNQELPYNELPRSRKWSHIAKANGYFPSASTGLFTGGVYSGTENKDQDLRFNLKSIFSRLSNSIIPGLALNVHFRWLDLANDNVSGTNTYTNEYDANTVTVEQDYSRDSAMSRDEWEVGFDSSYLLMRGVTLRGSYKWRQVSRDIDDLVAQYVRGDDDDADTEEHIAKVGINAGFTPPIINKPIRARLNYKYESITQPFANVNGVYTGERTDGVEGVPYGLLQEWRNTIVTNQPTRKDEIRFDTTVPILDRLSVTGFYRFIKEENDLAEGWKNWTHMPSVSIWYAPLDKLNFTMSYLYRHGKTSSLLCVPVYDG